MHTLKQYHEGIQNILSKHVRENISLSAWLLSTCSLPYDFVHCSFTST